MCSPAKFIPALCKYALSWLWCCERTRCQQGSCLLLTLKSGRALQPQFTLGLITLALNFCLWVCLFYTDFFQNVFIIKKLWKYFLKIQAYIIAINCFCFGCECILLFPSSWLSDFLQWQHISHLSVIALFTKPVFGGSFYFYYY